MFRITKSIRQLSNINNHMRMSNIIYQRSFCSNDKTQPPPEIKQVQSYSNKLSNTESLSLVEHALRLIGGLPVSFAGFYTVEKNNVAVIEYFGKYYDTKKEGLRFNLPFGRQHKYVFVGLRSLSMEKSKVLDKDGKPIIISAMLNYYVEDPIKYRYNVHDQNKFLETQASAVIKDIASKYSYNELKSEASNVTNTAVNKIQELVQVSGIRINELNLTDLSYSPEIAPQMLILQHASAQIEAKKMVVEASVTIINDILDKLKLDERTKNKAIVNLLTVLVSNSGVQNVVNLN